MKVIFILPYPVDSAPSQRLKFEQYFDCLKANDVEIEVSSFVSPEFRKILYEKGFYLEKVIYTLLGYMRRVGDIFRVKKCDVVYLHLEAAPFGPPIFEYIFYWMKKPIIYDIDDVVYLPHASNANRLFRFLKFPQKTVTIITLSRHVIAVTQHLKRFAERYNKASTCIPPTINTDKYRAVARGERKKICIGWTGSHSTSAYLLLIKGPLKTLCRKYYVRIKVVGDRNFTMEGVAVEAKDWRLEEEVSDIQDIDIGLYPLPKNEWVLGKGGLKALQYMGMGIPVVCTRVGAVLDFIEDGVNGFLADSDEEWADKISLLISDRNLRERMGLAARKTVEEKFSVRVNAPRYLEILRFAAAPMV